MSTDKLATMLTDLGVEFSTVVNECAAAIAEARALNDSLDIAISDADDLRRSVKDQFERIRYLEGCVRVRDEAAILWNDMEHSDWRCAYCSEHKPGHRDTCPTITHPLPADPEAK